jgi:hypothetical protein
MGLVAPIVVMAGYMVEVTITAGLKSATEPACPTKALAWVVRSSHGKTPAPIGLITQRGGVPCRLFMRIFHHTVGMGTGGAAVGILVVLVEGVGTPKKAVTVRTWVSLVSLVKFVFVAFPVELALKGDVAEGAPVCPLLFGAAPIARLDRRRGRCSSIISSL